MLAWLLLAAGDARDGDARLHASLQESYVAAHASALKALNARLAGLEATPPELLARTLAELATVYPEWARLLVCDSAGRVLVAWPKRDTSLVGAMDPSESRRAAFAAGAGGQAAFARTRPGSGVIELGVAQPQRDAPRHPQVSYVAGDLPHLEPRVGAASTSSRVIASWTLALFALLIAAAGVLVARRTMRARS